nr:type III-B CRISPR module-associated Cmr3 family protein [Acanthopleuribacter pedis]
MIPHDVLFFSDNTPFSTGTAAQSEPGGLFPPYPTTMAGAIRACLARENGWCGSRKWPSEISAVLGDGPKKLGALHVAGPYLLFKNEPVFPLPRHVLGCMEKDTWQPKVVAQPGEAVTCDLGSAVRLPAWPRQEGPKLKAAEGVWIRARHLGPVLNGQLPDPKSLIPRDKLWLEERRVGIARDPETRTAERRKLYSARHIRLKPEVSLGVQCFGLPADWRIPVGTAMILGGERRLVTCEAWDAPAFCPLPEKPPQNGRLTVTALTALDLEEKTPLIGRTLTTLGGVRVVSACLNRAQRVGGWDARNRKPLGSRCLLPAGSVLFCELPEKEKLGPMRTNQAGRLQIGRRRNLGYGAVALGTWTEEGQR